MALTLAVAGAAAAAPLTLPPPKPGATMAPATTAAINAAEAPAPYPSFSSIPPYPAGLRSVSGWKTAVLAIKADGAQLNAAAAAIPWQLSDTEGWAEGERALATPPPPVASPSPTLDTAAFAALMRQRATPPPPTHRPTGAQAAPQHP